MPSNIVTFHCQDRLKLCIGQLKMPFGQLGQIKTISFNNFQLEMERMKITNVHFVGKLYKKALFW